MVEWVIERVTGAGAGRSSVSHFSQASAYSSVRMRMRKHPELWQIHNVLPGSNTYLVPVRPVPAQASQLYEMAAGSILQMSKERLRVVSYHGRGRDMWLLTSGQVPGVSGNLLRECGLLGLCYPPHPFSLLALALLVCLIGVRVLDWNSWGLGAQGGFRRGTW